MTSPPQPISAIADASESPVPGKASHGTVTKTTINVQRGKDLSSMANFAAIVLDVKRPKEMLAKKLRTKLGSDMLKSDRFLTAEGFPLTSKAEESLTIGKLFVGSTESDSETNDEKTSTDIEKDDEPPGKKKKDGMLLSGVQHWRNRLTITPRKCSSHSYTCQGRERATQAR